MNTKLSSIRKLVNIIYNEIPPHNCNSPEEIVEKLGGKIVYDENRIVRENDKELYSPLTNPNFAILKRDNDSFIIEVPINYFKGHWKYKVAKLIGCLIIQMGYLLNEDKWQKQTEIKDTIQHIYNYNMWESDGQTFAVYYLLYKPYFENYIYRYCREQIDFDLLENHFQIPKNIIRDYGLKIEIFELA